MEDFWAGVIADRVARQSSMDLNFTPRGSYLVLVEAGHSLGIRLSPTKIETQLGLCPLSGLTTDQKRKEKEKIVFKNNK